jgi:hypothetical protein
MKINHSIAQDLDGCRLLEMINSGWISQALSTAAELGLADHLAEEDLSATSLARKLNVNLDAVHRLMRALASLAIVQEQEDGTFQLMALGQRLRSDVSDSLNAQAQWFGRFTWPFWGELTESVRTGIGGRQRQKGQVSYDHLQQDADAAKIFNRAMIELTRLVAQGVLAACDFTGVKRIVDVGGGHGELLAALLDAYPQMQGCLVDLAHAVDGAKLHLTDAGLSDRVVVEQGDFFVKVPDSADVYLLKAVLHNWDDNHCIAILATVRSAMHQGSRMILVERVLPDRVEVCTDHQSVLRSDLNMLVGLGGRERTASEFTVMLIANGFTAPRFLPAAVGFFAIECGISN